MKNEQFYNWDCLEFTTATKLEEYIDEIKPLLVGKIAKQLIVRNEYYEGNSDFFARYDLTKENENATIDLIYGPCILKVENHTFCFDMYGGSHIFLSLDKKLEILDAEEMNYKDISVLFKKNIMGQKITCIRITRAYSDYDFADNWYVTKDISDDMFKDLIIEFENGHSLNISIIFDNTGIFES